MLFFPGYRSQQDVSIHVCTPVPVAISTVAIFTLPNDFYPPFPPLQFRTCVSLPMVTLQPGCPPPWNWSYRSYWRLCSGVTPESISERLSYLLYILLQPLAHVNKLTNVLYVWAHQSFFNILFFVFHLQNVKLTLHGQIHIFQSFYFLMI